MRLAGGFKEMPFRQYQCGLGKAIPIERKKKKKKKAKRKRIKLYCLNLNKVTYALQNKQC
jgi:hypothetical protein